MKDFIISVNGNGNNFINEKNPGKAEKIIKKNMINAVEGAEIEIAVAYEGIGMYSTTTVHEIENALFDLVYKVSKAHGIITSVQEAQKRVDRAYESYVYDSNFYGDDSIEAKWDEEDILYEEYMLRIAKHV